VQNSPIIIPHEGKEKPCRSIMQDLSRERSLFACSNGTTTGEVEYAMF
jgi:hypothetical protein